MKKFSKYGMMLLTATLCLTTTSFTTDNTVGRGNGTSEEMVLHTPLVREGKLLLTKIHWSNGKQSVTFKVKYNSHYCPVEITSGKKGRKLLVDYNTGVVYQDGEVVDKRTFTRDGYIKTYVSCDDEMNDSISYSYDSQGHLVGIHYISRCEDSSMEYCGENVWENGNLLKSQAPVGVSEYVTIEYSDVNNRFLMLTPNMCDVIPGYGICDRFAINLGQYGIGFRKLPKKIIASDKKIHIFEYELNSDGSIRQETMTTMDEKGENVVHTDIFKFYYKRIK